ncbi:hypothetical protein FMEXI_14524 [Fusarium mexicanum]|uniref:Uncharacterized protein n=1 Tax=Fusarium mexicanum TaxID=751941 RepID=A0A8H5I2Q7_9HYPO|nr:hypothetical protein FMEXI_14524 [Fusarium mexicanum]
MTEASLTRLNNVASHELIGAGVRNVNVSLQYYDRQLAASLPNFAYFHIYGLQRHLGDLKAGMSSEDSPLKPSYQVPEWITADLLDVGEDMISAWENVYCEDPDKPDRDPPGYIGYRNVLRDAHREYKALFEAQEEMRSSGRFLSSIASAMPKMPFATSLRISDRPNRIQEKDAYFLDRDYYVSMRALMLAPHTWSDAAVLYTRPDFEPPCEFLYKMPVAVHEAGTVLRQITIQCSTPWSYETLRMSPSERLSLVASVQNLDAFSLLVDGINGRNGWILPIVDGAPGIVFDLLTSFISISSLSKLTIAFPEFGLRPSSLIEVLNGTPHARPRTVRLKGAAFYLGELQEYLDHFDLPCELVLEIPDLIEGSWADLAECLRSHPMVSTAIHSSWGGDFESPEKRTQWISDEEKRLNDYLQKKTHVNPFINNNA